MAVKRSQYLSASGQRTGDAVFVVGGVAVLATVFFTDGAAAALWVMALALLVSVVACALPHAAGRNAPKGRAE